MNVVPVSHILEANGLVPPALSALVPSVDNYKAYLIQPQGEIEGSAAGVWNRNRDSAKQQFSQFLADAVGIQPDLVITPEYSLPWDVLVTALNDAQGPAHGKPWVLGCESIKYQELEDLKTKLPATVTLLHEVLQADAEKFLDPLVYVFTTAPLADPHEKRTVVLVQFKTCPMGDDDHFEIKGLQRGTAVYQFGGTQQSLKLVSLICSDVFDFKDADAEAVYDRALIIHIQLNPKPRQDQYRQYRVRLLQFKGDETELICLNWARNVTEWCGETSKAWKNISASAWYLRPDKFDRRDETLCLNHKRGLYYTWLEPQRTHSLFLNFKPGPTC